MSKVEILLNRLDKIGIKIVLGANYPWIYLFTVNGNKVMENFHANHGYTLGFMPKTKEGEFEFIDSKDLFQTIRKYK